MAQFNGSGKNGKTATIATAATKATTTTTTTNSSQNEPPTDKSVLIEEVIEHKQDMLNGLHKVIF